MFKVDLIHFRYKPEGVARMVHRPDAHFVAVHSSSVERSMNASVQCQLLLRPLGLIPGTAPHLPNPKYVK